MVSPEGESQTSPDEAAERSLLPAALLFQAQVVVYTHTDTARCIHTHTNTYTQTQKLKLKTYLYASVHTRALRCTYAPHKNVIGTHTTVPKPPRAGGLRCTCTHFA